MKTNISYNDAIQQGLPVIESIPLTGLELLNEIISLTNLPKGTELRLFRVWKDVEYDKLYISAQEPSSKLEIGGAYTVLTRDSDKADWYKHDYWNYYIKKKKGKRYQAIRTCSNVELSELGTPPRPGTKTYCCKSMQIEKVEVK